MPRTPHVPVKPEMLRWARQSAGMHVTEAAKKLGVSEATLQAWEAEEAHPTARQVEKVADVYKRPVAALFLPAPPQEQPLPIDFRTRFGSQAYGPVSPKTVFAVRRARRLQRVFRELEPSNSALALSASPETDDPVAVASTLRTQLGVSIDEQVSWSGKPSEALNRWRAAVEDLGILVFQFSLPHSDTSGFSLAGEVPAIVLNRSDTQAARIFTLFHEMAHFLIGRPGLCAPEIGVKVAQRSSIEKFCNTVAGALIVPPSALLGHEAVRELRAGKIHIMQALDALAKFFAVSRHVILKSLLSEFVITSWEFRDAYRRLPQGPPPKKKSKGGEPQALKTIRELGEPLVARVCRGLERGFVSQTEAADYLSVGIPYVDRIHEQVSW